MPAVLDAKGWPTCCDYRLDPEWPSVFCPFCCKEYRTEGLLQLIAEHRAPQPQSSRR